MAAQKPSYEELASRLAEAEAALEALRGHEVDAVVGHHQIAYVRLKEVEDALRDTTQQLRDVLDSIRDAFLAVDDDWRITYVNDQAARMCGAAASDLVGARLWERYSELFQSPFHDLCRDAMADDEPHHAGVQLADGRWLSVSAYPSDGGLSIYWRDITESKLQEQEREAQRELLQALIENASAGVAVIDRDFRYTMTNPAYEQLPDIEVSDVVGRSVEEVLPEYVAENVIDKLKMVFETGERQGLQAHPLYGRDGESFWDVDYVPLNDADGNVSSVLAILHDVTDAVAARRSVEELAREMERNLSQLQAVMNSIDQGIIIFEPDGTLVMTNAAADVALPGLGSDFSHVDEMHPLWEVSTLSGELIPPDNRPAHWVARGRQVPETEYRFSPRDSGQEIICTVGGAPIYDEAGEMILGLLTLRDVTERVRIQEQLEALNTELERKVAERTQVAEKRAVLLQSMAADLLNAEQRERRRLSKLLHDHLQQILTAAQLRAHIVGSQTAGQPQEALCELMDLLTEAVEASRSLAVELSPPALSHGLPAALKWLADQMESKHKLRVRLDIDGEVEADTEEISAFLLQSARELLFNAVKHAGVRKATVRLTREDDQIVLEVSDSGPGFDPATIGPTGDGETAGTGLLNIRRRLDLLGGRLEIESASGEGAIFRLYAPVEAVPAGRIRKTQPQKSRLPAEAAGPGRGLRVMVVDDHDIVREGLAAMLDGYPEIEVVGEACDGATAVAMADELQPNVIVMDVSMPGMNGIEATREITSRRPEIRVIGLSMHEENDIARRMREAGASDYLTKGGPYKDLIAAIMGTENDGL